MTWEHPEIEHGKPTKYGWTVWHPKGLRLGLNTDIGWGCFIQAEYGVIIGYGAQIGGGTYIYSKDTQRGLVGGVIIGKDACIGSQSLILPGTIIEDGAKVPAHSVVEGHYG